MTKFEITATILFALITPSPDALKADTVVYTEARSEISCLMMKRFANFSDEKKMANGVKGACYARYDEDEKMIEVLKYESE
jgi:hypothetical protein